VLVGLPSPDVAVQGAELVDDLDCAGGIVDGGVDLPAVADDAGVAEQAVDVGRPEPGDDPGVEVGEGAPEVVALAQDRQPRQTGLEALEADLLEQPVIVMDVPSPLVIVVGDVVGILPRPPAAGPAVRADDEAVAHH